MRRLLTVVGLFAMVASCGFAPKPKDGKLPCDNGCPSGYVCRADNRCWLTNAPAVDSGADSPALAKDVSAPDGGVDGAGAVDGVSPKSDEEVSADTSVAVDVGIATVDANLRDAKADQPLPPVPADSAVDQVMAGDVALAALDTGEAGGKWKSDGGDGPANGAGGAGGGGSTGAGGTGGGPAGTGGTGGATTSSGPVVLVGGLVTVGNPVLSNGSVRLVEHGLERMPTVCGQVSRKTVCVSGGIQP